MATGEQRDEQKVPPKPAKKTPAAAAREHAPYIPPPYTPAEATAMQALAKGVANAHQQRMALDWIMFKASNYLDEPFRPGGHDGERDTNFALGRAFVGRQVAKLLNINLSILARGGKDGEQA